MRVSKWGNSLAVRLPRKLVETMGLIAGDEINIVDAAERTLVVQKEDWSQGGAGAHGLAQLDASPDYKFDRDEANER